MKRVLEGMRQFCTPKAHWKNPHIRGSPLSNTTCLTHAFFKSGE